MVARTHDAREMENFLGASRHDEIIAGDCSIARHTIRISELYRAVPAGSRSRRAGPASTRSGHRSIAAARYSHRARDPATSDTPSCPQYQEHGTVPAYTDCAQERNRAGGKTVLRSNAGGAHRYRRGLFQQHVGRDQDQHAADQHPAVGHGADQGVSSRIRNFRPSPTSRATFRASQSIRAKAIATNSSFAASIRARISSSTGSATTSSISATSTTRRASRFSKARAR